jgi:hypothetical protein
MIEARANRCDALEKSRFPFLEAPRRNQAIRNEGIAGYEFFCCFSRFEDCHGACGRIAEGTRTQEKAARVEVVESGAMSRKVSLETRSGTRSNLVEGNDLHWTRLVVDGFRRQG